MLTDTHTETARVLAVMLKENTGAHFLDSGGTPHRDERGRYAASRHGYGRYWERNRHRDFEAEPATLVNFKYDIEVTHNVYHWLLERVQYDAGMQELLHECRADWDGDDSRFWLEVMEMFPDWLRAKRGHEVTGLYGDGEPFTVNTYNGEDLLSQVLQYVYLEVDGDAYVLLQIHGGCDVCGGYTVPKAFRLLDDGVSMLSNADGRIYCEPRPTDASGQLVIGRTCRETVHGNPGERRVLPVGIRVILRPATNLPADSETKFWASPVAREPWPEDTAAWQRDVGVGLHASDVEFHRTAESHHWQTDDGCHWYDGGACGHGAGTRLGEYDRREIDDPADWEPGFLCIDEAGHGYCPKCGGRLNAM
jgi:hypothetical protein